MRRNPFTASQWQELEHQALIFKCISSGMPIPSDLILNMRRSIPNLAFALQPSMGWNCCHGSRKAEDPEPWRCRRTDGKKWRCSKEAHGDSKYCERHMHRGKNRSRKPVEITSSISSSSSSHSETTHQFMYPYHSSSRSSGNVGFQPFQKSTSFFHLDTAASYSDYRHSHGGKDVGELALLPPLGTEMGSALEFKPLGMNSTTELLKKAEEKQQQHCFVLGADFGKPVEEETQQPLRRFFDEWPQKTQLSMSTPTAYH